MAGAIRAALRRLNAAIGELVGCRVANRPAASAFADLLEPDLQHLADLGFGVWSHGSYYAPGLHDRIAWGEALRIGLAHYNTLDEMDRFNEALATVVAAHRPAPLRSGRPR